MAAFHPKHGAEVVDPGNPVANGLGKYESKEKKVEPIGEISSLVMICGAIYVTLTNDVIFKN